MFQANFMFTLMYFQKFHYQSTVFLSHRFEYHLCLDGELVTFGYWWCHCGQHLSLCK